MSEKKSDCNVWNDENEGVDVYVSESAADYEIAEKGKLDPLSAARAIAEETSINLFLTGKAGTGKTTFLRKLVSESKKRIVVLAPTGVAAINAGGSTIHSFFQLDFGPYIPTQGFAKSGEGKSAFRFSKRKISMIRALDLLVIDEVSMVRPDMLDAVDAVLRRFRDRHRPFGGVQLLLIGDLRQLAPVVQEQEWEILSQHYKSPYFFDSQALRQAGFMMIELTQVFRQSDPQFINILNAIRNNTADSEILRQLNLRANQALMPSDGKDEGYIRLTTHNYRADQINNRRMAALNTPPVVFEAKVEGKFPQSSYPAEKYLTLKEGAQVMFIKNDPGGARLYYNGLIGEVVELSEDGIKVRPRKDGDFQGADITVGCVEWENTRYELKADGTMEKITEGVFSQVPLRLAWAITIHKSQGLTFDKAIVDAAHSFAPGQTYVALSRCRSLEGLILDSPLGHGSIMVDPTVNDFIQNHPRVDGDMNQISMFKESFYGEMLYEMFNFRPLDDLFDRYYRTCASSLQLLFPDFMERLDQCSSMLRREVVDVAAKLYTFFAKYVPARHNPEAEKVLNEKISSGADYFFTRLNRMENIVKSTPLSIDNQTIRKRLVEQMTEVLEVLGQHLNIFRHFSNAVFTPAEYMNAKAMSIVENARHTSSSAKKGGSSRKRKVTVITPEGTSVNTPEAIPSSSSDQYIANSELYNLLTEWRVRRAGTRPLFTVLGNKSLLEISRTMPATREELLSVNGISKKRLNAFGDEILEIVNQYKQSH